jgi:hypothetical protein
MHTATTVDHRAVDYHLDVAQDTCCGLMHLRDWKVAKRQSFSKKQCQIPVSCISESSHGPPRSWQPVSDSPNVSNHQAIGNGWLRCFRESVTSRRRSRRSKVSHSRAYCRQILMLTERWQWLQRGVGRESDGEGHSSSSMSTLVNQARVTHLLQQTSSPTW